MFFGHLFSCDLVDDIQMLANIVIIDLMWTYLISWAVLSHEVATTIAAQVEGDFYQDWYAVN